MANEQQRFMIQHQVQSLSRSARMLLEPLARDTGAAVCGAAAFHRACGAADDVLLILPADHLIRRTEAFLAAVAEADRRAREGHLVTFGLIPSRPETGFGYIAADAGGRVERFVEKPDLETAKAYCMSGRYLWNSGMFAFRADTFLAEMARHAPGIYAAMTAAVRDGSQEEGGACFTFAKAAMAQSPSISIDHALMEKTEHAVIVRCELG